MNHNNAHIDGMPCVAHTRDTRARITKHIGFFLFYILTFSLLCCKGKDKTLTGVNILMYPGDTILRHIRYYSKKSLFDGLYIYCYRNGKVCNQTYYKKGRLNGSDTWYYRNGNLECILYYNMDKENGPASYYYESGFKEADFLWKNGKLINYGIEYYDSSMEIKSFQLFSDEGCYYYKVVFNRNGKIVNEEGNHKNLSRLNEILNIRIKNIPQESH